jgi:hypothetical protein
MGIMPIIELRIYKYSVLTAIAKQRIIEERSISSIIIVQIVVQR